MTATGVARLLEPERALRGGSQGCAEPVLRAAGRLPDELLLTASGGSRTAPDDVPRRDLDPKPPTAVAAHAKRHRLTGPSTPRPGRSPDVFACASQTLGRRVLAAMTSPTRPGPQPGDPRTTRRSPRPPASWGTAGPSRTRCPCDIFRGTATITQENGSQVVFKLGADKRFHAAPRVIASFAQTSGGSYTLTRGSSRSTCPSYLLQSCEASRSATGISASSHRTSVQEHGSVRQRHVTISRDGGAGRPRRPPTPATPSSSATRPGTSRASPAPAGSPSTSPTTRRATSAAPPTRMATRRTTATTRCTG